MPAPDRLRSQVAQRADAAPARPDGEQGEMTIFQMLERQKGEIQRALPKHLDGDRLARIVATVLRQTPALLECDPLSLLGATMLSAQTGLEPGPLGHAYFIPFWNNNAERVEPTANGGSRKVKFRRREVQWIMGYKGIVDLAMRSGELAKPPYARAVYAGDFFEYEYGLEEKLVHRPIAAGDERDPKDVTHVYGVAKFKDGSYYFDVLTRADVERRRARSKAKDSGPWVTDWVAMAKKSVIRAMQPYLPLTIEIAQGLAADERVHRGIVRLEDMGMALPSQPTELTTPDDRAAIEAAKAQGAAAGEGFAAGSAESGGERERIDVSGPVEPPRSSYTAVVTPSGDLWEINVAEIGHTTESETGSNEDVLRMARDLIAAVEQRPFDDAFDVVIQRPVVDHEETPPAASDQDAKPEPAGGEPQVEDPPTLAGGTDWPEARKPGSKGGRA